MATKTIPELEEVASVDEVDFLLVSVGGVTRRLSIATLFSGRDVLEVNKAAGDTFPTTGTIRYAAGEIDPDLWYSAGFIDRWRGFDTDGETPLNIGHAWAYSQFNFVGAVQNIAGFGDWDAVPSRCPHLMRFNFRQNLSFNFAVPTAEGDLAGFSMDSWPVSGGDIVYPGQVERRTLTVDRHTNFVVSGQRDHIVDPEDVMALGEGVFYLGWADVNPTGAPTQGVTFWASTADSKVRYVRPNGNIVCIDNGVGQEGLDLPVSGSVTLSATQAEHAAIIVAPDTSPPSGAFDLVLPNTKWKRYEIHNKTLQTLNAKRSGGASTAIPAGKSAIVRHTGTEYELVGAVSP